MNSEDFITSGAGAANSSMITAFQNTQFFGRFKSLKEKYIVIQPTTLSYDGANLEQQGAIWRFKLSYKWRGAGLRVHFNSTNGGTVADIVDHSFHLIVGCSNISLAPRIQYKVRTAFSE